jgi:hypothetical protein
MINTLCKTHYCPIKKLCLNYTDDPTANAKKYNYTKYPTTTHCYNFIQNFQKEQFKNANSFIRH